MELKQPNRARSGPPQVFPQGRRSIVNQVYRRSKSQSSFHGRPTRCPTGRLLHDSTLYRNKHTRTKDVSILRWSVCTSVPLHGPPSPRPPVVLDPPVTSESPPMFSKSFSPLMSRNQSSNSGGSSAPSSRGAGPRWSQAPTSPPVAGMTGVGGAVVLSSGDAPSGGRSTVLIASDASTSGWPRSRRAHRRTSGRGRGNKGWVGG